MGGGLIVKEKFERKLTCEHLNKIVRTLPTAYYLKQRIPVIVSEEVESSCFIPADFCILISLPQINEVDFTNFTPTDYEWAVRCTLYHEIAHAMLSPTNMGVLTHITSDPEYATAVNIFEDQRIETILKDYFMGVDFEKFCKAINRDTGIRNPLQYFFNIVRFKVGTPRLVEKAIKLIEAYSYVNTETMPYYYFAQVINFYKECKEEFEATSPTSTSTPPVPELQKEFVSKKDYSCEISRALNKLNRSKPNRLDREIEALLYEKAGLKSNQPLAIKNYHGRLTPRLINRPNAEPYKWWVQKANHSEINCGDAIQLNLFIDCSESFRPNVKAVNELLSALSRLEQKLPYFKYTLTQMGEGHTFCKKYERFIEAYGCNVFNPSFKTHYKSLQRNDVKVYNLVLFDGCAWTALPPLSGEYLTKKVEEQMKFFSLFDAPNTILISDGSNSPAIEKWCHKCRVIIPDTSTTPYSTHLHKNILTALKYLL